MKVFHSCDSTDISIWRKMKFSIKLNWLRLVENNIPSFTSWKYLYHRTHNHSLCV